MGHDQGKVICAALLPVSSLYEQLLLIKSNNAKYGNSKLSEFSEEKKKHWFRLFCFCLPHFGKFSGGECNR